MSEFIGSRISLISKSDIRYVGTLVEINSENSTVALENVMSYGTEDRRTGADSFPPSSSLYDYILFRGSDVKDLRIEEPPKEAATNRPQMPNDPAILGSARPDKSTPSQQPAQPSVPGPGPSQGPPNQQGQHFPPHPSQFNQFGGPYGGMPPQGFGRGFPGGPPPGPGFPGGYPGMQFGPGGPGGPPPPGWYGPPNQNFGPPQFGAGPPPGPNGPDTKGSVQLPNKDQRPVEKDTDTKTPEPVAANRKPPSNKKDANAPPPPVESKPDVAAALAPPHGAKNAPKGRVQPAVPMSGQKAAANGAGTDPTSAQSAMGNMSQSTAQQAAAAVAAAMARLPNPGSAAPSQSRQHNGVEDLTRKLGDMRTHDGSRGRGTRGSGRGRGRGAFQKVEIPATDFDFESANKKFNKEDVAKEAQIGSPDPNQQHASGTETPDASTTAATAAAATPDEVVIPPAAYNKTSSFFDNISSELKDREEQKSFGGSEFRYQERRKNMETFGQGSIDGGRGGFRGRGRGRGRGGQGRGGMGSSGGYGRGRGAPRETAAQ